ncbi:UNVERIFIED_CONTAM: hypothetical protein FKN15_040741 [Acipenser sinensis]
MTAVCSLYKRVQSGLQKEWQVNVIHRAGEHIELKTEPSVKQAIEMDHSHSVLQAIEGSVS